MADMDKINVKIIVIISIIVVFVVFGIYKFNFTGETNNLPKNNPSNVMDLSYLIDGENFSLKNGVAEKEIAPNSSSKNIVRIFGQPVYGDLDKDGDLDVSVLLQNDSGGSGIFYYAVLVINNDGIYRPTNAMFLGDRIAPQTVEIRDGRAVYNFAERRVGEPMIARPSIGKSIWINYDKKNNEIGEWVKGFEGEADISKMTLDMKKWNWVKTSYNNDKEITPRIENKFTMIFRADKTFSATTDCNSIGGDYILDGNEIFFRNTVSTMMYCDGSQENDFLEMLGNVGSYLFTSKGELVLELKYDSGSMIFR